MADLNDIDGPLVIIDRIDDPEISLPDSVSFQGR